MDANATDERTNEIRTAFQRRRNLCLAIFNVISVRRSCVCVFFPFSCSFRYSFLYRRWVRTSSHCICSTVRMVALLFYSFHHRKSTIVSRTNGSPQIELGNVFLVHRAASTFFFGSFSVILLSVALFWPIFAFTLTALAFAAHDEWKSNKW